MSYDLQTKFNDFYKSGLDAKATYNWANKTITENMISCHMKTLW